MNVTYLFTSEELASLQEIWQERKGVTKEPACFASLLEKGFLSLSGKKIYIEPTIALIVEKIMHSQVQEEVVYQNCPLVLHINDGLIVTELKKENMIQVMCFQNREEVATYYPQCMRKAE